MAPRELKADQGKAFRTREATRMNLTTNKQLDPQSQNLLDPQGEKHRKEGSSPLVMHSTISIPRINLGAGLQIGYGTSLATLQEAVDLSGGTHFLLARNGRGKTTLLRTIARGIKQISGELNTHGNLQYLPEDLRFDAEITPSLIFKTMLPKSRTKEALELAKSIELDVKKPYGRLSTGNRRKTGLIMVEFSLKEDSPNVLLLDEPFSGLDAFARQAFEEIWRKSGQQVLRLVSCHPDYDSMLMPSALMIESGRILHVHAEGQTWSNLKSQLN